MVLKQGAATREESGKGGGVVIRCPAVERAPVEGLKRRIRELQRFQRGLQYVARRERGSDELNSRTRRAVTGRTK